MRRIYRPAIALTIVLTLTGSLEIEAQCVSEDFEELAVGQAVTTQIDGVSFYVEGQSCGGAPVLYLRIAEEFYGDTFASRVLAIDGGCPDFSPDYLRMIFADKQGDVRFGLGPWAGTYQIRAYDTPVAGTPILTQSVTIPGTGFVDAYFPTQVARVQRDIRRIEIEASASGFEAIDDLRFGADSTPPEVQIDFPAALSCITGEITVTGIACDDDGAYDRDRLEYMRTWPNPQTEWTLVREYVGSPVCEPFSLYAWDTTEPGVTDGVYSLRVTSQNGCGMATTEQVTVRVDNGFDLIDLRSPATGGIVGGAVCFDGTASDMACFDHYAVQYRPAGGGSWYPVNSSQPIYVSPVSNDPLAVWSDSQGLTDGDYSIAVAGTSATGHVASRQISVTLDDTPPIALIETPGPIQYIEGLVDITGTATDENLLDWELHYNDPFTQSWINIDGASAGVTNGLLAEWDTTGLTPGFYTLRLRVKDRATVGCGAGAGPHITEDFRAVAVSVSIFADGFETGGTTNWSTTDP